MNSYLIDANQLVYSLNPASPQRTAVVEAFRMLVLGSHPTYLVPQSLTEFWVVATKPVNLAQPQHSGLGLTTAEARAEVDVFRATFDLLPDAPAVFEEWLRIVLLHDTKGKKAHDARLVAFMWTYGVDRILTNNVADFARYPRIQAVTLQELPDLLRAESLADQPPSP